MASLESLLALTSDLWLGVKGRKESTVSPSVATYCTAQSLVAETTVTVRYPLQTGTEGMTVFCLRVSGLRGRPAHWAVPGDGSCTGASGG